MFQLSRVHYNPEYRVQRLARFKPVTLIAWRFASGLPVSALNEARKTQKANTTTKHKAPLKR